MKSVRDLATANKIMLKLLDASIIAKKRLRYHLYLYFYAVRCIHIWFFCSLYRAVIDVWGPLSSMHFVQLRNLSGSVTYNGL